MEIFLGWIIFSFVAGAVGSGRKIGFWGAFLLSIFLSPLIGLIFALVSKSKEKEEYEKGMLETQKKQQEALDKLSQEKQSITPTLSVVDELAKLTKLKNDNLISEEEFQKLKDKILHS
ncbi:MAG: SHOCT domain-containing protein [Agriterribacter sp.]